MVASRGSGIGYPAGGSALTQGHRFPVSTHLWRCHCRLPVRGLAPSPARLDSSTGDTGEAAENMGHAVYRPLPPAPRPRARANPSGKKRTMTCPVDLFIQAWDEGRVPEAATPTSPRCCSPPGGGHRLLPLPLAMGVEAQPEPPQGDAHPLRVEGIRAEAEAHPIREPGGPQPNPSWPGRYTPPAYRSARVQRCTSSRDALAAARNRSVKPPDAT